MNTFTLDIYKDWDSDRLKRRCRELCRATMHKDVIIAVLAKYGLEQLSKEDREYVERICSQWDD